MYFSYTITEPSHATKCPVHQCHLLDCQKFLRERYVTIKMFAVSLQFYEQYFVTWDSVKNVINFVGFSSNYMLIVFNTLNKRSNCSHNNVWTINKQFTKLYSINYDISFILIWCKNWPPCASFYVISCYRFRHE